MEHLPVLIEAQGFWRQMGGQNQKHMLPTLGDSPVIFQGWAIAESGTKARRRLSSNWPVDPETVTC